MIKTCRKCGQEKDVNEFTFWIYKGERKPKNICKKCRNIQNNIWRKTDSGKESTKKTQMKRAGSIKNKKSNLKYRMKVLIADIGKEECKRIMLGFFDEIKDKTNTPK